MDWRSPLVPAIRLGIAQVLLVDFGDDNAGWVEFTDVLVDWFYSFGLVDHVSHVHFVDLLEVRIQIRGTLLFELFLRLEYLLGLFCIFLALGNLVSHRVFKFAWFEHITEDVHYRIVFGWVEVSGSVMWDVSIDAIVVAACWVVYGCFFSSSLVWGWLAVDVFVWTCRREVTVCVYFGRGIGWLVRIAYFIGCFLYIVYDFFLSLVILHLYFVLVAFGWSFRKRPRMLLYFLLECYFDNLTTLGHLLAEVRSLMFGYLLYLFYCRLAIITLLFTQIALPSLLASFRTRNMTDLMHIRLVVDQVDSCIPFHEDIDVRLLKFIERMVGDQSDLEKIREFIQHSFYITVLS